MVDVCVTHPLASSAVAAAAWGTGMSAKAKDALKRDKYGRTGTGACRFVPLSHETYGRAGLPAFALLRELAEFAASTGAVSKKIFMEIATRDLSTTLCRGIARQVLASAPLRARLDGRPVLPGRPVPTDGLGPSSHQDRQLKPAPAPGSVVLRDPHPPLVCPKELGALSHTNGDENAKETCRSDMM